MGKKIVVVGGGISGLSAAYALMRSGLDVAVLENSERGGGSIRTGMEKGYLFEYGPNSTMNSNDEIDSLCKELGLEEERIFGSESSKKRYVMRGGQLIPLPTGGVDFIRTKLWKFSGKLRLLKEPFTGRKDGGYESVADFVRRRVGGEFLDYAIDPFVSGVYAGDPEKLELKSTFPKMHELEKEHGSLIVGAITRAFRRGQRTERKRGIFSFREGMESLPKALVKALGERFRGGVRVQGLEKKGERYVLKLSGKEDLETDEVVLSSPAYANAEILSHISPVAAEELSRIDYAPVAVVYLGFERKDVAHPLDGFGCLIPGKEGKKLLGSLWSSTLFPGRAPEEMVSVTNFIGGARNRELVERSDKEILELVLRDLRNALGIKGEPSFIKVIKHRRAIPQYNIGHAERLEKIGNALAEFRGLHLLGNYLRGVSVADCVMNGVRTAREIEERLAGS